MGEAKNRAAEIEAMKAAQQAEMQQRQMMAYMMGEPAVYANGFYLALSGRMVRVVILESSVPEAPSKLRGSFVIHPEDAHKTAANP